MTSIVSGPGAGDSLESTSDLLARAKDGDVTAIDALFARSLPPLRRWARGRLPQCARDMGDTQDLVQETVIQALRHLETFEPRHPGALQAYLRQSIVNRIRDEVRRVRRRPAAVDLDERLPDTSPSPLERAIGHEGLERYEAALRRLHPDDRDVIIARFELQQSYDEIAAALAKPTAAAARMAVTRALARLIDEMDDER